MRDPLLERDSEGDVPLHLDVLQRRLVQRQLRQGDHHTVTHRRCWCWCFGGGGGGGVEMSVSGI